MKKPGEAILYCLFGLVFGCVFLSATCKGQESFVGKSWSEEHYNYGSGGALVMSATKATIKSFDEEGNAIVVLQVIDNGVGEAEAFYDENGDHKQNEGEESAEPDSDVEITIPSGITSGTIAVKNWAGGWEYKQLDFFADFS